LTGGIREGVKGDPPVAIFTAPRLAFAGCDCLLLFIHLSVLFEKFIQQHCASGLAQSKALLIFFFSFIRFLAYDTVPEEIYLSG
jgi:hypothetical protein